jgi:hypothetical protein
VLRCDPAGEPLVRAFSVVDEVERIDLLLELVERVGQSTV